MISKVLINNDKITVVDPTPQMISWANQNLSYTDKSKQYQLRRMAKSLWHRNSPAFAKLQKEVNGSLFSIDGNVLTMSTCFLDMFFSGGDVLGMFRGKGQMASCPRGAPFYPRCPVTNGRRHKRHQKVQNMQT